MRVEDSTPATIGRIDGLSGLSVRPSGLRRGTASPQLGAGPMAGPGQPHSRYAIQGMTLGARRCAGRSPRGWCASRGRPNTRPTQLAQRPARIELLKAEQRQLEDAVANPELYK